MKVGFYLDNVDYKNINFSKPELGNPGIRGTQYMIWTISTLLGRKYEDMDIYIYAPFIDTMPADVKSVYAMNIYDAIQEANSEKLDIFVLRPWNEDKELFDAIEKSKVKFITWGHNFENLGLADIIAKNIQIKRHVCVGRQQYERLRDHEIFNKATYIYNCLNFELFDQNFVSSKNKENIVTYVGALNKLKGFHVLAKAWKKVIKQIPNAKLQVIGTGSLGNGLQVGKYGLAPENYEKKFIKYLIDSKGNIIPSVHFLGNKGGKEKENLMRMSKIGIANPTGRGETFCIVAIEFEAVGVPVISVKRNGLLDTVCNKQDGILIQNSRQLSNRIVKLLSNDSLCDFYGKNGVELSKRQFDLNIVLNQWHHLLTDVYLNIEPEISYKYNHPLNQAKIFREWNRKLRATKYGKNLPSLLTYESLIRKFLRK